MLELNIAQFDYTKEDGERSKRKLLVLSKPSDTYFGIEVGHDLTPVQTYLQYLAELRDLEENLKAKYGIKNLELPYKRFKADKMTKLQESKLQVLDSGL